MARSMVVLIVLAVLTGCLATRPPQSLQDRPDAPTALSDVCTPPTLPTALPVPPAPLRAETHSHFVYAMVTAYEPSSRCCGPNANGFTSTMVDTRESPYGIAVDPRVIGYGSCIRVPGYLEESHPGAWWIADDTGAAMRHDGDLGIVHIDVRFKSHASAVEWGVRYLWIEISDQPLIVMESKHN